MIQIKQTGIVGPWRPAFLLSFFFFALTTIIIFHNEFRGNRFCQSPNLINDRTFTFVACTIGATVGHFGLQVVRMISKFDYETVSHGSAQWMVLLITGIQALSQSLMFYFRDMNMVCEDYFGVRTSTFLWVEWLSTVPVMFYLTSIMDINKLALTTDDKIVIFCAGAGLVCLCALNYTTNHYMAVFLMTTANVIMTYALFWLHGGSYMQHMKAVKNAELAQNNEALTSLSISVKKRKLVCAGFMNYFFSLFPVAYFLKTIDVLDHDTMFMTFCILNFLSKGIFATLVTESHTELLDPKTFLLFSEKARSEQGRRAFMRYMFEEVRVPLKSVTLGIALLKNSEEIRGADRETVSMIKDAADYMAETLNDVLAIEKIEEGKLVLDKKPFHILDLLNAVKEKSEGMCARQRLRFNYGMDSDVPTVVKGDRQRLEQVMSTLVQTAVNSSSEGGEVSISVAYGTRVTSQLTFSVRGSAPGISLYEQRTMFKHVSQINPEELGKGKSSGMGLAICTDIVELHDGTIGCESLFGTGAELFINLPLEVCDDEDEEDEEGETEAAAAVAAGDKVSDTGLSVPSHLAAGLQG